MIFVFGFLSCIFGWFAFAILDSKGKYNPYVHRGTDLLVLLPFYGGCLAMLWSVCYLLWGLLP